MSKAGTGGGGGITRVVTPEEEQEFTGVRFTPFGEAHEIVLTPALVNQYLTVKTRTGRCASPQDVRVFLERCAAGGLNPWLGDAYLIGYDLEGGGAQFSLITSHQALLKRAEASPAYDGMDSGVITVPSVLLKSGDWPADPASVIQQREGDLLYPWETVIGGWARVYRKDRARVSSDVVEFDVYSTGKSRWQKDPAGMIVKVAEGSALRKAFPSTLSGLYCQEEMESLREGRAKQRAEAAGGDEGRTRISGLGAPRGLPDNLDEKLDTTPADDRRVVVPTKDRPVVHPEIAQDASGGSREESAGETPGKLAGGDPVRQAEPEGILPEEVANIMQQAGKARTETALLMVKRSWIAIRDEFPEHVEVVEARLARRAEAVAPAGKKAE